jgi:hypothetical protein
VESGGGSAGKLRRSGFFRRPHVRLIELSINLINRSHINWIKRSSN